MYLFIASSLMHICYLKYKGCDYVFLISVMSLFYFYPLLMFNDIYFLSQSVHSVPVDTRVSISIIIWQLSLLLCGLILKIKISYEIKVEKNHYFNFFLALNGFLSFVFAIMLIKVAGFGLLGRSKSEIFPLLGHNYKLFILFGTIFIAGSCFKNNKLFYLVSILFILFDMTFGFRGLMATFIICFVLTRKNLNKIDMTRLLKLILAAIVSIAIIVFYKDTNFLQSNLKEYFIGLIERINQYGPLILSIINPESSSVSSVYNEVVRNEFKISCDYLVSGIVSAVPFITKLGFLPLNFSEAYKLSVFGYEASTFSSGCLAFSYSLFGFVGVILLFIVVHIFFFINNIITNNFGIIAKVMSLSLISVFIVNLYRSEFDYIIVFMRSIILCIFVTYILTNLFFINKKNVNSYL